MWYEICSLVLGLIITGISIFGDEMNKTWKICILVISFILALGCGVMGIIEQHTTQQISDAKADYEHRKADTMDTLLMRSTNNNAQRINKINGQLEKIGYEINDKDIVYKIPGGFDNSFGSDFKMDSTITIKNPEYVIITKLDKMASLLDTLLKNKHY